MEKRTRGKHIQRKGERRKNQTVSKKRPLGRPPKKKPIKNSDQILADRFHTVSDALKTNAEAIYSILFNPSNPKYVEAWDELYCMYLDTIKMDYNDFYYYVKGIEEGLSDQRLKTVLLLYRKVIPTIDPSDYGPLALLHHGIKNLSEDKDVNMICIFVQIATKCLNIIEKKYKDKMFSIEGHVANSLSSASSSLRKQKESAILIPIFVKISQDFEFFSVGYKNYMVNELFNHEEYLLKTIRKFKKEYKDDVDKIDKLYWNLKMKRKNNQDTNEIMNEIKENVENITKMEAYFEEKYKNYISKNVSILALPNTKIFIEMEYVLNCLWHNLESWPIYEYLKQCFLPLDDLFLTEKTICDIMLLCEQHPQSIQEINDSLSSIDPNIRISQPQLESFVEEDLLKITNSNDPSSLNQKYQATERALLILSAARDKQHDEINCCLDGEKEDQD